MDKIEKGEKIKKSLYDDLNTLLNKDKSQQQQIDTMNQVVQRAKNQMGG